MKFLSLVLLLTFVMPVHASFLSLSCSNATGTVIWEEGANSNLARLTYNGFVTGVLDIERHKLSIVQKDEVTLRAQLLSQCDAQSSLTTFAARVVITPSPEFPDVFMSYFPDQRIAVITKSIREAPKGAFFLSKYLRFR